MPRSKNGILSKTAATLCVVSVVALFALDFDIAGLVATFVFFEPVLAAFGLDGDIP